MRSTKKTDLESLVSAFLEKKEIGGKDSLLAAYSGGPDSSCLLYILFVLKATFGYSLSAAYVEHGIRPADERSREVESVTRFCGQLGIPLYMETIGEGTIVSRAADSGSSTEAVARSFRYKALRRIARDIGASYILLGHTLDDHLETIIMRFFQGSGERGLAGISSERGMLLRPFLTAEKGELIAYMEKRGVAYTEDSTNNTSLYLRNRVRVSLIPAVKEIFPGYKRALAAGAEKMRIMSDFLKTAAARTDAGRDMDIGVFNNLGPYERLSVLYDMTSSFTEGTRIPFRSLRSLLYVTIPHKNGNLLTVNGVRIQTAGNRLFCEKDIVYNAKNSYFIVIEGEGDYSISRNLILTVRLEEKKKGPAWIRYSQVNPPLVVRSRLPGDVMETAAGRKKLKSLFIDWHLPERVKNIIPVVEDREGIMLVLGKVFGFKDIEDKRHMQSPDRMTKHEEKGYTFFLTYMGAK